MTTDLNLDAIEARANAALNSPTGQSYDAGVILSRDVPALVALVRAKQSWIDGAKVDMAAMEAERDTLLDNLDDERVILGDALRERDDARAALARVEALCDDDPHKADYYYNAAYVRPEKYAAPDVTIPADVAKRGKALGLIAVFALAAAFGLFGDPIIRLLPWNR